MPIKKILVIRVEQLAKLALVESGCHRLTRRQKSGYLRHSRKICRSNSNGEGAQLSRSKSLVLLPAWLSLLYKYVYASSDASDY